MNLFLVENSNYVRERLAQLVARQRDTQIVGLASTAPQAIKEIRRLKPDVVLLDIRLDEGTGLDVLRQIKQRPQPPIVIVLTNYAYPQYRAKFLESGADYFFDKSTELDAMVKALNLIQLHSPKKRTTTPPRSPRIDAIRPTNTSRQIHQPGVTKAM